MNNFIQARFNYKKACHLNQDNSKMHYKIACTYMNEGNWNNAIKSLQQALKFHLLHPEYNLALGRCYLYLENYDEAITYLGNVVRIRPKNSNGWIELLNCLFQGELFEEGLDYTGLALEQTDSKAIFLYYKAAFLMSLGQNKEGLIYLEHGLSANPKMVKQLIELKPSLLQNQQVVDLISRYKTKKSTKK